MKASRPWIFTVSALLLSAAVVTLGWWVWPSSTAGPTPIAWDREACAHCRMHIGDPSFAAQLQTLDGQVLNFDDPGCLASFLKSSQVQPEELWFHRFGHDGWLRANEVGFIRHEPTPMGYGFVAVPLETSGAVPWPQARQEMLR